MELASSPGKEPGIHYVYMHLIALEFRGVRILPSHVRILMTRSWVWFHHEACSEESKHV